MIEKKDLGLGLISNEVREFSQDKKNEFKHVGQSQSYGPGRMAIKKLLKRNDWPHISREVEISFGTSNVENNKNLADRFLKHTSVEDFDRIEER